MGKEAAKQIDVEGPIPIFSENLSNNDFYITTDLRHCKTPTFVVVLKTMLSLTQISIKLEKGLEILENKDNRFPGINILLKRLKNNKKNIYLYKQCLPIRYI